MQNLYHVISIGIWNSKYIFQYSGHWTCSFYCKICTTESGIQNTFSSISRQIEQTGYGINGVLVHKIVVRSTQQFVPRYTISISGHSVKKFSCRFLLKNLYHVLFYRKCYVSTWIKKLIYTITFENTVRQYLSYFRYI